MPCDAAGGGGVAAAHAEVHVSTLGLLDAGAPESMQVDTRGLLARSGYAQSKYVAVRVVASGVGQPWWPQGRRAMVMRPGVLCGDVASGASNEKDAVSMMLCGMLLEGATSLHQRRTIAAAAMVQPLPVDSAAAAVAALVGSWKPGASVPVYNLCARTG